jgi:beta-lactamase regulating signal transducer with metallopeptidase domain
MTSLALEWILEGVAVAAVATFAVRLVPCSSAAKRHGFWWLTFASVLALPWLSLGVRHQLAASFPTVDLAPAAPPYSSAGLLTVPAPPQWLLTTVVAMWALLVAMSLVRLGLNVIAVRRLASNARPLPRQDARLRTFDRERAASRDAVIGVSDDIRGACAVGFLRPHILLSSDLTAVLDDEAIEAIVLHEYAHLQRYDDWTRLVQRVVLAFAGLHPAVRWISRHIDIEREAACDRVVIERTGAPVAYARSLTAAAEIAARTGGLTPIVAPGASTSGAGLHARVTRLIAARVVSRRLAWSGAVASSTILAGTLYLAAQTPPLVRVVPSDGQQSLLALASVPLQGWSGQSLPPAIRKELAHEDPQPATGRVRATPPRTKDDARAPRPPIASPRLSRVASAPADAAGDPAADPDRSPIASSQAPLAAKAFSQLTDLQISGRAAERQKSEAGSSIGSSTSRMGVNAGDAAARAGTSVGRLFKNGGLAIANRF